MVLASCLQDILERTREFTLHGVRRGASVALAMAQVQTRHDLISMELGFPMVDDPDTHEDLIAEFDEVAIVVTDIPPAQDVVNKVFE